jgi:hypothetical protein
LEIRLEPKNMKHLSDTPLQGRLLALPTKIRLGWQYLPETNTLTDYKKSVNYGHKKFYNFGPRMLDDQVKQLLLVVHLHW